VDWRIRFKDGYQHDGIREASTEEQALKEACALREKMLELTIEGPNGVKYDEIAIANWCRERGL
jgi:hypothetical protein